MIFREYCKLDHNTIRNDSDKEIVKHSYNTIFFLYFTFPFKSSGSDGLAPRSYALGTVVTLPTSPGDLMMESSGSDGSACRSYALGTVVHFHVPLVML